MRAAWNRLNPLAASLTIYAESYMKKRYESSEINNNSKQPYLFENFKGETHDW